MRHPSSSRGTSVFFAAAIPALLALSIGSPVRASIQAGPIVNPANGHAYYLLAPSGWTAAEAAARGWGGHLATVGNDAENSWIWETFAPLGTSPFWIGFTDAAQEGSFVWVSGEPTSYTNWWTQGGQPSNDGGVENYTEIKNYVWNDNIESALLAGIVEVAGPVLTKTDFRTPGDGLLVQDAVSALEWLSPTFTKGQSYNDVVGGFDALLTTEGFSYATRDMVVDLINSHFAHPPVGGQGTPAGFASAEAFFAVFGINFATTCGGEAAIPCPRTQGLTVDAGPSAGTRLAVGMQQFGTDGSLIDNNPFTETYHDSQLGHWLVRPIPEPSSDALACVAAVALALRRRASGRVRGISLPPNA